MAGDKSDDVGLLDRATDALGSVGDVLPGRLGVKAGGAAVGAAAGAATGVGLPFGALVGYMGGGIGVSAGRAAQSGVNSALGTDIDIVSDGQWDLGDAETTVEKAAAATHLAGFGALVAAGAGVGPVTGIAGMTLGGAAMVGSDLVGEASVAKRTYRERFGGDAAPERENTETPDVEPEREAQRAQEAGRDITYATPEREAEVETETEAETEASREQSERTTDDGVQR